MFTTFHWTLTLTGTTGSQDSPRNITGRVVGVYLKYTSQSGPPSTTLTTKGAGSQAPALTILSVATANTNGWFFPKVATVKAADGSAITTWFDDPPVDDFLTLAVTAGGTAGSIDVWVVVETES